MDPVEYLRLMRYQREDVLAASRRAFDGAALVGRGGRRLSVGGGQRLSVSNLSQALSALDLHVQSEVLEGLLQEHGFTGEELTFDQFVRIEDCCRTLAVAEGRQRAGFSAEAFNMVKQAFFWYDRTDKGYISLGKLVWVLSESNVPVNSLESREAIFRKLDAARQAAIDAGVPQDKVGQLGDRREVPFWAFLHLVRIFLRDREQAFDGREKEALNTTKFSPSEVAQFRQIFSVAVANARKEEEEVKALNAAKQLQRPGTTGSTSSWASEASGQEGLVKERSAGGGSSVPTLGSILRELGSVPSLPVQGVAQVLRCLRLQVTLHQHEELSTKLEEISEGTMELDFAGFLQLMRWMLDTDYAGVTSVAKKTAAESRKH
jgi:Ca2+-binding EF-hand superfamily protein